MKSKEGKGVQDQGGIFEKQKNIPKRNMISLDML
jgi:hypothetical protein